MAKKDPTGGRSWQFFQNEAKRFDVGDKVMVAQSLTRDKKRRRGTVFMITDRLIIISYQLKLGIVREAFVINDIHGIQKVRR